MCGRFVIAFTDGFHARFSIPDESVVVRPRFNIAPTQDVPVVVRNSPNRLELMRWGLVPSWSKEERSGMKLINARCESVKEKPMFRKLLSKHRCLVPATGFYEWMSTDQGKVPYYIRRRDKELLAFAGLYDHWRAPDGSILSSFTILTTAADEIVLPVHDRMPVILTREDEEEWLEPGELEDYQLKRMFTPFDADQIESYPVAKLVRDPTLDRPELIQPVVSQTKTIQMHF